MAAQKMSQGTTMMFGVGALSILGDQLKMRGLKRPVIITDKGVTAAGVTAKVEKVIKDAELECVIYDDCLSDAPSDSITVAADAFRAAKGDCIVALGGGSSMDTAKAVSRVILNPRPITEVVGPPAPPDVPIFTIPTTSGTGSEVTLVGVISNSQTSKKFGIVITGATLAIVDPELTVGVPPSVTAATGMDVVAHCVEAITGQQRNPMSDLRGYESLRLVVAHLPAAVKDGTDIVARTGMSLASSLAGLSFSDSITTLGHAVAQGMASVIHLHHGLLCGLGTPAQLEVFAAAVPERIRKIAEIFGADVPLDATNEEIGKIAGDKMREFMAQVGLPSFEKLGFSRAKILEMVDVLMEERMKDFSPIVIDKPMMERVLNLMCDYNG
ncbi:MAG: iron-containing alcohol dehydrogenase [Clostridiales bacterium]|nr:iron-containing alcohol dehydrogenase [Clostridiales bacterium]